MKRSSEILQKFVFHLPIRVPGISLLASAFPLYHIHENRKEYLKMIDGYSVPSGAILAVWLALQYMVERVLVRSWPGLVHRIPSLRYCDYKAPTKTAFLLHFLSKLIFGDTEKLVEILAKSITPTTFPRFAELPEELRYQIWGHTFEPRIIHVDPFISFLINRGRADSVSDQLACLSNPIFDACRESNLFS